MRTIKVQNTLLKRLRQTLQNAVIQASYLLKDRRNLIDEIRFKLDKNIDSDVECYKCEHFNMFHYPSSWLAPEEFEPQCYLDDNPDVERVINKYEIGEGAAIVCPCYKQNPSTAMAKI